MQSCGERILDANKRGEDQLNNTEFKHLVIMECLVLKTECRNDFKLVSHSHEKNANYLVCILACVLDAKDRVELLSSIHLVYIQNVACMHVELCSFVDFILLN